MKLLFVIRCVKSNIAGTPSHIFVMAICRGVLPWEFAVAICRGNLPQLFAVEICHSYLLWVCFVYVSKPFCLSKSFFFASKSFLFESKPFLICKQKLFLFPRISSLTLFLFVIAVAVMGHRTQVLFQHFLQEREVAIRRRSFT